MTQNLSGRGLRAFINHMDIIPESETPKSKTSSGNVFMKQNSILIKPQAIYYVALYVDFWGFSNLSVVFLWILPQNNHYVFKIKF